MEISRRDFGLAASSLALMSSRSGRVLASDASSAYQDLVNGRLKIGRSVLANASAGRPYSIREIDGRLDRLRFEVRTGDRAPWDEGHGAFVDRSEVFAGQASSRVPYGRPFWWRFDMFVEGGPAISGDWCVLAQLHQSAVHPERKGVNPPFSICWHTEGRKGLSILTRSAATSSTIRDYISPRVVYLDADFPRGTWVNLSIQATFNWTGNAQLQVWRNDKRIVDLSDDRFKLGYEWDAGKQHGVYCQFGIYRASAADGNPWKTPDANPMVVRFANFNFGTGLMPP